MVYQFLKVCDRFVNNLLLYQMSNISGGINTLQIDITDLAFRLGVSEQKVQNLIINLGVYFGGKIQFYNLTRGNKGLRVINFIEPNKKFVQLIVKIVKITDDESSRSRSDNIRKLTQLLKKRVKSELYSPEWVKTLNAKVLEMIEAEPRINGFLYAGAGIGEYERRSYQDKKFYKVKYGA